LCVSPGLGLLQQQQQQQQSWDEQQLQQQQAAGAAPCPTFQRWKEGRLSGDGQQHQTREGLRQCFAQQVQ
jgi:hypothetical protein